MTFGNSLNKIADSSTSIANQQNQFSRGSMKRITQLNVIANIKNLMRRQNGESVRSIPIVSKVTTPPKNNFLERKEL